MPIIESHPPHAAPTRDLLIRHDLAHAYRDVFTDQALEARVRAFVPEGEAVTMQHYIAER